MLGAVLLAVSDPDWIPKLAQRWYEAARLLVDVENSELGAVSDVLRMIASSEHRPDERDLVSAWITDSAIGRSLVKYATDYLATHKAESELAAVLSSAKALADSVLRYRPVADYPEGKRSTDIGYYIAEYLKPFEAKCHEIFAMASGLQTGAER